MGSILTLFSWPLRKLAYAALLALLGLTGAGLWIFLHDGQDFAERHRSAVKQIAAENAALKTALVAADAQMAKTRTEIAARQLRADQAAKVASNLDDMSGGFSRLTTSSAQLQENDERIARMKQMETDSRKRAADLDQNLTRIQWQKDGIEIAMERNRTQAAATTEDSPLTYLAQRAWNDYGTAVLIGVVIVMLLPSLWRIWRVTRN